MIAAPAPGAAATWGSHRVRSGAMDTVKIGNDGLSHTFILAIEGHASHISAATGYNYPRPEGGVTTIARCRCRRHQGHDRHRTRGSIPRHIKGSCGIGRSPQNTWRRHASQTATAWLGAPKHPVFAQRGDIVMKDRTTLDVCVGLNSWFVGEEHGQQGLVAVPTSECTKPFTLPFASISNVEAKARRLFSCLGLALK